MDHNHLRRADDRLFEALKDVFLMEPDSAIKISKEAACLIVSFVVDTAVTSEQEVAMDTALSQLQEMQLELADILEQLRIHNQTKSTVTRH